MRQETARILNLVFVVFVIAVLWGVATMRNADDRNTRNPKAIHPIQNEPSHA